MNSKLINQLIHIQYHECTSDKELFIASIKEILENTSLKKRTEQELWNLTWDKVYFAGTLTENGRNWINRIREEGSLDNFNKIPEHPETAALMANTARFEAIQKIAKKFLHCFALYEDVRKAVSEMQGDMHSPENIDIIRRKLGVMPKSKKKGNLYNDLRVKGVNQKGKKFEWGVAHTTVLHMLTDYGFPVCKPDLWVARLSDAFCKNNNELEDNIRSLGFPDFSIANCSRNYLQKENNVHYNFLIIDYLITNHFDSTDPFFKEHEIDIESQFNKYRFIDLILAKLGMSLEEGFGMNNTPFRLLVNKNEPLREKYAEFAQIVDIVEENKEKFRVLELTTIDDYKKKIGSDAKVRITCRVPIEVKGFSLKDIDDGEILDVVNENVLIKTESYGEVSIAFNNIDEAELKTKKTGKTQGHQRRYNLTVDQAIKKFKKQRVDDEYFSYSSRKENRTKYPIVDKRKYDAEIIQTIYETVIEKIRIKRPDPNPFSHTDLKKVFEIVVLAFHDYDTFKSEENNQDMYPEAVERINQKTIIQEIIKIDSKFSDDERLNKIKEIFSKYNSDEGDQEEE
jgi:hypothetical protein